MTQLQSQVVFEVRANACKRTAEHILQTCNMFT